MIIFLVNRVKKGLLPAVDILLSPIVYLIGLLLNWLRTGKRLVRFNSCKNALLKAGIFLIRDHYYEPLFNPKHLRYSLRSNRLLPGIDLNLAEQLETLRKFDFNEELLSIPLEMTNELQFYYYNNYFEAGDA
jgi:hypothetical protein